MRNYFNITTAMRLHPLKIMVFIKIRENYLGILEDCQANSANDLLWNLLFN